MAWIEYKGFEEGLFLFSTWVWVLIGIYLLLPVLSYLVLAPLAAKYRQRLKINSSQILVCVLGDLGHSPRMCNHVLSLSQSGFNVRLCGYLESQLPAAILDDEDVDIYEIKPIHNSFHLPYLLFALYKVVCQFYSLTILLFEAMENSLFILIQNPPSMPLLLIICVLQKLWFNNCQIIVDWHNLNYTILNLKFQNLNHPVVKLMKRYESFFSHFASLNLTVTNEMNSFLSTEFNLPTTKIMTLYDKAPPQFQPLSSGDDRLKFISSHPEIFTVDDYKFDPNSDKLLISSTSFTPDEDFSILLDALESYDKNGKCPNVFLIITGKGPLKSFYENKISNSSFNKVRVKFVWLPIELYPKVLSVADLGISLHTSSSGIDLPMKIVDLFGCGVPVVSLDFKAIGELVKNGVNGVVVKDSTELSQQLQKLLTDKDSLAKVKEGALEETTNRWESVWNKTLGRYLMSHQK